MICELFYLRAERAIFIQNLIAYSEIHRIAKCNKTILFHRQTYYLCIYQLVFVLIYFMAIRWSKTQ